MSTDDTKNTKEVFNNPLLRKINQLSLAAADNG